MTEIDEKERLRKEARRLYQKRWLEKHPGYQRAWRQKNIDKVRAASRQRVRAWRERHPEYAKEYYKANTAWIAEKSSASKKANPEKFRHRERGYLERNVSYYLLRGARARARARKLAVPCTITCEWIKERIDRGCCEVTGLPFERERWKANPWSPSLDRIVGSVGYTPENTQVVVWAYNAAKGHWTSDDVMRLAKAIVDGCKDA